MKRVFIVLAVALLASPAFARPAECDTLEGASIVSEDGTYLGKIADEFDTKSIFNKFGTHGSQFSSKSIWNEFGIYGSDFSNKSVRNEMATSPPMIIVKGRVVGYLSRNKQKAGAISPLIIGISCYDYEPG